MSGTTPLDLEQVDPAIWHVLVDEKLYGPYTLGQLKIYVAEGRITEQSRIAEGSGAAFIEAKANPKLEALFEDPPPDEEEQPSNNFVIVAHLNQDRDAFIAVLNELGSFAEALPGTFLLRSPSRLADVQSRIRTATMPGDHILIVDASNNRLGWLGLDFDTDAHIKSLWRKSA